jgi:hypothetical protein
MVVIETILGLSITVVSQLPCYENDALIVDAGWIHLFVGDLLCLWRRNDRLGLDIDAALDWLLVVL